MRFDGGQEAVLDQLVAEVIDQGRTACQAANRVDKFQRMSSAAAEFANALGCRSWRVLAGTWILVVEELRVDIRW
jgi:hypothetical protein